MKTEIYENKEDIRVVKYSHFFEDIIPILFGKTVHKAFVQKSTGNIWVETIKVWRDKKVCVKEEIYKSNQSKEDI